MLALHDRTRRSICRAAFLALGPLPTAALLMWAAWLHTPLYRRATIDALARRLNSRVRLQAIVHPAPGRVRYLGLVVADPERDTPLFSFDTLDALRTPDGMTFSAPRVRLSQAGLDRLWDLLAHELAGPFATAIRWRIGQIDRAAGGHADGWFYEVRAGLEPVAEGRQLVCEFRADRDAAAGRVQVKVVRNRNIAPPVTIYELDARDAPLPCPLLATRVQAFDDLGDRCRFQGYLWARESPDRRDAELVGTLFDCDLARVAARCSPHRIDGTARIDLERVAFRGGRLVQATGRVSAGAGALDRSLYDAAIAGLALRPGGVSPVPQRPPRRAVDGAVSRSDAAAQPLPFDQLAFRFHISSEGLWIAGQCEGAPRGALAVAGNVPVLFDAARQPQAVSALVRTFAPQNGDFVPATVEADRLARLLPLPAGLPRRIARQPSGRR